MNGTRGGVWNTSGTSTLRTVTVGDREIGLRYMTPDDPDEMLRFAPALPPHDLLLLPIDVTEVEGLNDWIDSILIGTAGVILAVDDGGIVGFSSVTRNPARWVRHVAELRVVIAESMRGHHLGHHLTAEAFRIAVDLGVTRVMAQMTMDQLAAIRTFRELGFTPMAILHDHVIDDDGAAYDLKLLIAPRSVIVRRHSGASIPAVRRETRAPCSRITAPAVGRQNLMRPTDTHDASLLAPAC